MMLVVGPYKFYLDQTGQLRVTADMPEGPPQSLVIPHDQVTDFFRFLSMVEDLINFTRRRAPVPEVEAVPQPVPVT